MKRGLRQGDPISHFLYLIIAEGLSLLLQRAVDIGSVKPALIGKKKIGVSYLQYVDNTIFMCDGVVENLKSIKRIPRLFELASCLKVNYAKSRIHGLNCTPEELNEAANL
ncbi:hypothetical protein ACS0TY_005333 [Phlomoides rotata]